MLYYAYQNRHYKVHLILLVILDMSGCRLNETDGNNLSLLQMAGDEQRVLQFIMALSISLNR